MTLSKLRETEDVAGRVDRDAGVIRGVKIIGRISKNGREYDRAALDGARSLYEGAKVNVDHPTSRDNNRNVRDVFGTLHNVRSDGESLRGDLHYLKSHVMAASVCEAAERMSTLFGLSHNAEGEVEKTPSGRYVVRKITRVHSVDLVSAPATNTGLFEETDPNAPQLASEEQQILDIVRDSSLSIEDQVSAITDILQALRGEAAAAPDTAGEASMSMPESTRRRQAESWAREIAGKIADDLNARPTEEACALLLTEAGRLVTDHRVKMLREAGSDARRVQLLRAWPTAEQQAGRAVHSFRRLGGGEIDYGSAGGPRITEGLERPSGLTKPVVLPAQQPGQSTPIDWRSNLDR